jgi:hypothetical protein
MLSTLGGKQASPALPQSAYLNEFNPIAMQRRFPLEDCL